ncbi:MAG: sensor histidine kinase [Opitutaceae bacterium]
MAVLQQGEFLVLNDTVWREAWQGRAPELNFNCVATSATGAIYYGVFGSWGEIRRNDQGALAAVPRVPADAPEWVGRCNFRDILCVDGGVFFWGQDGVVYLDTTSGSCRYFPVGPVSWLYPLAGKFVVSTFGDTAYDLDLAAGTLTPIASELGRLPSVIAGAGDGVSSLVLATATRQLLALRGGRLEYLRHGATDVFPGPVRSLTRLAEGGFAAAVAGYGVLLLDANGAVRRVFDGPEFRSVTALSSNEAGVLWAVTEQGVLKVLHGQPFTVFGREQGLPVYWPQLVQWRGRTIASSGGRLFEATARSEEGGGLFKEMERQPNTVGWGLAVVGDSLLIGNGRGVYEADQDSGFSLVFPGVVVARLVALDANTCLVVGTETLVVLRRRDGQWVECAPRLPGIGYPYVVHAGDGTAWIELGVNRVARIALTGDRLDLRLLEDFAWTERSWVNVSLVGSTVILGAGENAPMFLDDRTLTAITPADLQALVARSPHPFQRVARDEAGNLWVSHRRGLFVARPTGGGYEPDFAAFGGINEVTPLVQCLAGGGVWASTDSRLYSLTAERPVGSQRPVRPVLVGLRDARTGVPLALRAGDLGRFRYAQNSLLLDFFAGSHGLVRPAAYEYRLGESPWMRANTGSSVILADLAEGPYVVAVRIVDATGPVGLVSKMWFYIEAPWYRSWIAYVAYPLVAILVVYLAIRFAVRRHRLRLAELERQVDKRTADLRRTMDCLREETTANATLAERNRLAGEIHDSLEQGLAGLFLQLETTVRLPGCAGPVKAGLAAGVKMVAYCREELRNAVCGLRSPALQSDTLETALGRIVAQQSTLSGLATVRVDGTPRRIDPAIEHHLLRIAQEGLGNAVKHSGATRVTVLLRYSATTLRLSIVDNGQGFDPATVGERNGQHLGLQNFRTRAGKIGGTVQIASAPGRGTAIHVDVPIAPPEGN